MSVSDRSSWPRRGMLAVMLAALCACGTSEDAAPSAVVADAGPAAASVASATAPAPTMSPAPAPSPAASAPASPSLGTQVLNHPEDLQMVMLAYRLQARVPPVADWAAAQSRVKHANEFERAGLLAQETTRLQDVYDSTADIGRLRLNVTARLSEYDSARGGFYLDAYMPGSTLVFGAAPAPHPFREERVSVSVDNGGELNFWSLDPATAQDVLARNGGMRNVVLDSHFEISGISRRSDGPVLSVRLVRYSIISTRYNQPAVLGELRFDGGVQ